MTITDKIKNYWHQGKEIALAAIITGSTIYVAEKTGLTDALVQTDKAIVEMYNAAHEQAPWLVWTPTLRRPDGLRRVGRDIDLGLTTLMITGLGIALYQDEKKKYKL